MPATALIHLGVDHSNQPITRQPAPFYPTEYRPLSGGSLGAFQTLDAMVDAICGRLGPDYSGFADPHNKRAADAICAQGPDTRPAQIAALFDYVAHSLAYVAHPTNEQTLQDCRRTLEIGAGDCVSKSVCLATLLMALGHTARLVAQCDGDEFTHVYVEVAGPSGWLALDPVAADEPIGWSQPLPDGGFETPWGIL